jgi:flagellar biosynthesis/type III secretory pathway chaperone
MLETVEQQALEALFYKKIMLYNDLRECLQKERDHLIQMDLNSLWDISKQKESLCASLVSTRKEILGALNQEEEKQFPHLDEILAVLPREKKSLFQSLFYRLAALKSEVEAFRRENVHYVDDSLQFIDEMIAIIAGETRTRNIYDRKCQLRKTENSLLLRREV